MGTRHRASLVAVALVAISTAFAAPALQAPQSADAATASARASRQAFHDAMRKLWEDHITWTRLFIVSKATLDTDLPDIGPTVDRLLQNQTDIGDAVKPFYGTQAGEDLTALLRIHILTAADILTAAKKGDTAAKNTAIEAWYANAHDIAVFLHEANPRNWPLEELDAHMKDHLDLTLTEAVARLEGRYEDDIAAYDAVHLQILEMADMLSDGIIRQFPQQFGAG
jgi:type II secretory pathway pseudopilin PulG